MNIRDSEFIRTYWVRYRCDIFLSAVVVIPLF